MSDPLRVLVIDDDPSLCELMKQMLGRWGFEVSVYRDGERALASLERKRPDLVSLDMGLDGMEGLEVLRQLKRSVPKVPVVVLSGYDDVRTIVEAMRLGASDFLRKPFEPEELELAFKRALEAHDVEGEGEELRDRAGRGVEPLIQGADDGKMREVRETIEQVADTDVTVLVLGESGTGKELVARTVHQLSQRRDQPFVKVNCAALPSELLESELFGFERGAFTGAQKRKLGKFEYANKGTVFLDEIGEMSPALQAKLLQVLQDGEFSRLGGEADVRVDARVIAATNRNLEEAVRRGEFREDLYYRLNVVTVPLPPLRERRQAIPLLAEHFMKRFAQQYGKERKPLSPEAIEVFSRYAWPGNVRELENMVRRMIVMGSEQPVLRELRRQLPLPLSNGNGEVRLLELETLVREEGGLLTNGKTLDLKALSRRAALETERRVIEGVLQQTRGSRKEAARRLQISYKGLLAKMKESGLRRHDDERRGSVENALAAPQEA